MPPAAFVVVPRIPPTFFDIQSIRPLGLSNLSVSGSVNSLRGTDIANEQEDPDSGSLHDYQQEQHITAPKRFQGQERYNLSNNRHTGSILGPPAGFGDSDDSQHVTLKSMDTNQQSFSRDESGQSSLDRPQRPARRSRSRSVQSVPEETQETCQKSTPRKGKKKKSRIQSREPSPFSAEEEIVVRRVEQNVYEVSPSAVEVPLSASLLSADVNSTLGKVRLLQDQNDQLIEKQHELQAELDQQATLQDLVQRRTKSASKQPDNLSSQELGSLLRESHSVMEQSKHSNASYRQSLEERIAVLEEQRRELVELNEKQLKELESMHRQRQRTPRLDSSEASRLVQELRDDNDKLKSVVHRLNQELSRYQTKFRPLTEHELDELPGLPKHGPKPSWLVNTKYLAPLVLAYDDQLKEKDDIIKKFEVEMEHFQQRADEIVKENERLHIRIEQMDVVGPVGISEWRHLQEQCKLVLEENELLMAQLEVQDNKYQERHKTLLQEVLKLRQRTTQSEAENTQAQHEAGALRTKYDALRHQYEELLLSETGKIPVDEHINTLAALKQKQQDEKMTHAKELGEITTKLQSAELECQNLQSEVDKLNSIVKQLENEIQLRTKNEKKYQKSLEHLQATMDKMHMKGLTVEQYLSSVLKTAAKMAEERDDLVQSIEERDKDKRRALKKVIAENVNKSKMKEKMLSYRQQADEKIAEATRKLKDRETEFGERCDEYERQIKHLRQLLKEKDDAAYLLENEKKCLADDLETMWQTASKDNRQMRATVRQADRKLQQHLGLCSRFPLSAEICDKKPPDTDCILDLFANDVVTNGCFND